jgi:hypothetical protein
VLQPDWTGEIWRQLGHAFSVDTSSPRVAKSRSLSAKKPVVRDTMELAAEPRTTRAANNLKIILLRFILVSGTCEG